MIQLVRDASARIDMQETKCQCRKYRIQLPPMDPAAFFLHPGLLGGGVPRVVLLGVSLLYSPISRYPQGADAAPIPRAIHVP